MSLARSAVRASILAALLVASLQAVAQGADGPVDCRVPSGIAATRPDPEGTPTRVDVATYVVDVNEISDTQQRFTADLFFRIAWTDPRLAALAGCTVAPEQVWNPRPQLVNRRSFSRTLPDTLEIGPGGRVTYAQRGYGDFSVPLDLHDFPFDHQRLGIQAVALGYSPAEVAMVFDDDASGRSETLLAAGWEVGAVEAEVVPYTAVRRQLASVFVSLPAHRDSDYFIWKFIAPLTIVVCMAWLVQWIDPGMAPARIGLSATAVLTVFAYQFSVSGLLPRVSYVTRMDRFFLGATFMVLVGLLLAVLSEELFRRERPVSALRVAHAARWAFPIVYLLIAWLAITA